jgi:hypothetical protein
MSRLVCPRCHRANPGNAVYCYHDGVVLQQDLAVATAPSGQLPHEFVFPSGRRCRSVDDLVQGCYYEWEDARDLLRKGAFEQYLTTVGRLDLAQSAREARREADPDIALHSFVNQLPVQQVQKPRLDLAPRRIALPGISPGETRQVKLSILNQGKGLLQGRITVSEGEEWLRLEPQSAGDTETQCGIKTARDQPLTLRIDTRGLPAPQSYAGKLTVVTNGGIAQVPVRFDLGAIPFPEAPFTGAVTQRELAEKMRSNPKPAVALLENGDVQRWFQANGWNYPVQGVTAQGVAAVQQFFECMGLSKPPPLQLSESEIDCMVVPPEVMQRQVLLRTGSKKWVYAQVDSDVPWLRVLTPNVSGPQQTTIEFEIDSTLMEPGRIHEGALVIVANAGQKLALHVRVDVRQPHEPFTKRLLRPFFAGALLALIYRLLLVGPADLYARVKAAGTLEAWLTGGGGEEQFIKFFVLATWWLGTVGGFLLLVKHGSRWSDSFCGAIAGTVAGVTGAATLACLLLIGDAVPRSLLLRYFGTSTLVWIALASLWWAALGGVGSFVLRGFAGGFGGRIVAGVAAPLSWLLRVFGLERAAEYFVLA